MHHNYYARGLFVSKTQNWQHIVDTINAFQSNRNNCTACNIVNCTQFAEYAFQLREWAIAKNKRVRERESTHEEENEMNGFIKIWLYALQMEIHFAYHFLPIKNKKEETTKATLLLFCCTHFVMSLSNASKKALLLFVLNR